MNKLIFQFIAVLSDAKGVSTVECYGQQELARRVYKLICNELPSLKILIEQARSDLSPDLAEQWSEGMVTSDLIEAVKEMYLDEWLEHMSTHAFMTIEVDSL